MNAIQKGYAFENWITQLYINLGKQKVTHNVLLKDEHKHIPYRGQFDVMYGNRRTFAIECKYRDEDKLVGFDEITTFAGKLYLFKIPYKRGIVVTNTDFADRAKVYAHKRNITLVNNEGLIKLHKKTLPIRKRFFSTDKQLEDLIFG